MHSSIFFLNFNKNLTPLLESISLRNSHCIMLPWWWVSNDSFLDNEFFKVFRKVYKTLKWKGVSQGLIGPGFNWESFKDSENKCFKVVSLRRKFNIYTKCSPNSRYQTLVCRSRVCLGCIHLVKGIINFYELL